MLTRPRSLVGGSLTCRHRLARQSLNFEVAWAVPHGFSCNWAVNWWLQGLGNYSQSGCELFNVHCTIYCWSGFFACESNHDSTTISSQIFITYKLPLFKSEFGSLKQVAAGNVNEVCTHREYVEYQCAWPPSVTSYMPVDWLSPIQSQCHLPQPAVYYDYCRVLSGKTWKARTVWFVDSAPFHALSIVKKVKCIAMIRWASIHYTSLSHFRNWYVFPTASSSNTT